MDMPVTFGALVARRRYALGIPLSFAFVACGEQSRQAPTCGWTDWSEGLSGGSVGDVVYANASTVYLTTGKSIFASDDGGRTFSSRAESDESLSHLAVDPNHAEVVFATTGKGLRKSTDGGRTWATVAFAGSVLSAVAIHPVDSRRMYVALRKGEIQRSDDGGVTWSNKSAGVPHADTRALSLDPNNPDVVFVSMIRLGPDEGYTNTGLILMTQNGGTAWQAALEDQQESRDVKVCPADRNVVYAGTYRGLHHSKDGGATWEPVAAVAEPIEAIDVAGAACEHVYVAVKAAGIRYSGDGGVTFVARTGEGLTLQSDYKSAEHLRVNPANDATLMAATHGGAFLSTDRAVSWALGSGVLGLDVDGIASSQDGTVWLSTWGSGLWRKANGKPWTRVGLDAIDNDFIFTVGALDSDPSVLVGSWDTLLSSTEARTFGKTTVKNNPYAIAFDPNTPSVAYVGTQTGGFFKSIDGGKSWAQVNSGLSPWPTELGDTMDVRSLAVSKARSSVVVAGTNKNGIVVSTNGGQSWAEVHSPADGQLVPSVVRGAEDKGTFLASVPSVGVLRSEDFGATWSLSPTPMPESDVASLAYDPTCETSYLTSKQGVFVTHDRGITWEPFGVSCMQKIDTNYATLVESGDKRWLVVTAGSGVFAQTL